MIRFAPGLLGVALFGLWIYAVFDVIATDNALVRNLPKLTWLFVVILIPPVGPIAWMALGRPRYAGWRPGDTRSAGPGRGQQTDGRRPRPRGPEDGDDWPTSHPPNG